MNVNFDHFRRDRIGIPESVFCQSKDCETIERLLNQLIKKNFKPVLLTRLSRDKYRRLKPAIRKKISYDAVSRCAFFKGTYAKRSGRSVAIVTAGSSDHPVAIEASKTLEFLGIAAQIFPDIGVAGLWRLEKNLQLINACDAVIVVAGMDAAIVSVLGGLTARPVIAVPTSVGYGVADGGHSALNSMLSSCAPGIVVTNIDNGYGAACAAYRILGKK